MQRRELFSRVIDLTNPAGKRVYNLSVERRASL